MSFPKRAEVVGAEVVGAEVVGAEVSKILTMYTSKACAVFILIFVLKRRQTVFPMLSIVSDQTLRVEKPKL